MPPENRNPSGDSLQIPAETSQGTLIGVTRQNVGDRLVSIDIFRGLTMLVMIFVNDLDSVKGLPWWTYHRGNINGMTYVDVVFPTFLFIIGMAIPIAVKSRLAKDPSEGRLWLHVLARVLSLLVLGLVLANADSGDQNLMRIAPNWWAFTALIGAFLFWNAYPRKTENPMLPRVLKTIGLLTLIVMFAIFRRTTHDGRTAWIDTSYWEILGIIGWAYLSACILYLPTRRRQWTPTLWFVLLLVLNVASNSGLIKWAAHLPPYIWPFQAGDSCLIVMAGVVTAQIFFDATNPKPLTRKLTFAFVFASVCLALGWMLTPLGISKIKGTPTWCLYCVASSIAVYSVLYWLCDVKGQTKWAWFVRPAGSNTLTTYLIPDLYYFAFAGTILSEPFNHGWQGVVRAVVFAFAILAVAAAATTAKIRLRL